MIMAGKCLLCGMINRLLIMTLVLSALTTTPVAADRDVDYAWTLAGRLSPQLADKIEFR